MPFLFKDSCEKAEREAEKFWKEEGVKTDRKEKRRDRGAEGESNDYNVLSRSFVLYG